MSESWNAIHKRRLPRIQQVRQQLHVQQLVERLTRLSIGDDGKLIPRLEGSHEAFCSELATMLAGSPPEERELLEALKRRCDASHRRAPPEWPK